jgi:Flp pilus assembly protein TadD
LGGHADEALSELRKAVELAPESAEANNILGVLLARSGNLDEGIEHMTKAVELAPDSAEFHFNLGRALAAKSRFSEALPQLEAAAKLSNGQDAAVLQMLAGLYSENGRYTEAVTTAQRALALAVKHQNDALAAALKGNLERYTLQAQGGQAPDGTKR